MITADKDDPRFDASFFKGNHLRYFIGTFLNTLPSYMSLGFECRGSHFKRNVNEAYTKLYVFQIDDDTETDKVTHGPYVWGENYGMFGEFQAIKIHADVILKELENTPSRILSNPSGENFTFAWERGDYIFVANLSSEIALDDKVLQNFTNSHELIYSSKDTIHDHTCLIYKRKQ